MGGGREILGIWFDFRIEKPSETFTLDLEVFGFMSINSPPQAKKIDLPLCLLPPPPLFFSRSRTRGVFGRARIIIWYRGSLDCFLNTRSSIQSSLQTSNYFSIDNPRSVLRIRSLDCFQNSSSFVSSANYFSKLVRDKPDLVERIELETNPDRSKG